jgi:hypothetical protein
MHISIADVAQLRHQIKEIYDDLERRNSEFRDMQGQDIREMESNHELTLFMKASLNNLQERVAGVDGALVSRGATITSYIADVVRNGWLNALQLFINKKISY